VRDCVRTGMSPAQVMRFARSIHEIEDPIGFRTIRLSILATSNVDFLTPSLEVTSFADRILLKTWNAGLNQIEQQVLNPSSTLYEFSPDITIIAARAEDIVPELAYNTEYLDESQIVEWIGDIRIKLNGWFIQLTKAGIQVIFLSFARPTHSPLGIREFGHPKGHTRIWNRLNDMLAKIIESFPGVCVIDFDGLLRRIGLLQWEDPKLWALAKIAGGAKFATNFAHEIMPIVREKAGKSRKCLVLDLDNTLWGGIIGEDGIEGVKLGGDYPGNIFKEFQRLIIDLWKQGILLAINSKNNKADVESMIEKHPEMLLKLEHFISQQINWQDKVENLRVIAKEINIGMDSLVFVDDNPVECNRVRTAIPEVTVFQVPSDLSALPRQFAELCKLFVGITLSEEDRGRNQMYLQNQQRQLEMNAVSSVEEYLRTLEMKVEVDSLNAGNLQRVVQLFHKTNQFNVTTRRHSELFLSSLIRNLDWVTFVVRLTDKFGDNGIVLVALVNIIGKYALLDTFLMSCRVIGRSLEYAAIGIITNALYTRGVEELIGEYIPTAKNKLVEKIFLELGFVDKEQTSNYSRYTLAIKDSYSKQPEYIMIDKLSAFQIQ